MESIYVNRLKKMQSLGFGGKYEEITVLLDNITQDNRTLQLLVPSLGSNILVPLEVNAREAISQSFSCTVECIANDLHIEGHLLLGNHATVIFLDKDGNSRFLNGIIDSFQTGTIKTHTLRRYCISLTPQFATLAFGSNCQFFKDMTAPEIFKSQCKKLGLHDIDASGLSVQYQPLIYKAQFNETNFDFLSRILEEAGISYYYQHTQDKHVLKLVDNPAMFASSNVVASLLDNGSNGSLEPESNKAALFSWINRQTAVPLQTRMSPLNDNRPQHWDYPSAVSTGRKEVSMRSSLACHLHYPDSLASDKNRHLAQTALNRAFATEQMRSESEGNYRQFCAGKTFQLASSEFSHGLNIGPYLITDIAHHAFDYSYLPENLETELNLTHGLHTKKTQHYQNSFGFIHSKNTQYAPKHRTKKPLIPDLQPAFVTGPKGHKKDVYTNKLGQIQVRFPWDRSGQNSCFIPVSHSAAGSQFGTQFIPRIGQEVLVSYIGGDLDLPIIIGAVVNGATPPAYDLSENPNLTWIKSHSLNANDPKQGHHLLFDDTPNQEQLSLKSQKNYIEEVLNNSVTTIEGNDEIHIGGNASFQALSQAITLQGKTLTLIGGGSELIISEEGIELKGSVSSGGRIELRSKGAGPMKPVARLDDKYTCAKHTAGTPHHGGPIASSAHGLTANKRGIARQGDKGSCQITTDHIKEGIASILVNGKPIARLDHGMQHGGVITSASKNVFVGEKPEVKPTPARPFKPLTEQDTLNLLYATGSQTFYALTEAEIVEFEQETEFFKKIMEPLAIINEHKGSELREHNLQTTKRNLNQALKPYIASPSHNDITEVIHFNRNQWTYVKPNAIKSYWHSYQLDNHTKKRSLQESTTKVLTLKKLKEKMAIDLKVTWRANTEEALVAWRAALHPDVTDLEGTLLQAQNTPYHFDASAGAQLLRFMGETGASADFNATLRQFSFSADSQAQLDLLTAHCKVTAFIPSSKGWPLVFQPNDPKSKFDEINFGAFLVKAGLGFGGYVGASVLGSVNLNLSMEPKQGKAQIKGSAHPEKKDESAALSIEAFAGAKAGGEVDLSAYWKNPEIELRWSEFAALTAKGDVAAGLSFAGEFEIKYSIRASKFLVHAKAALVCGPGLSGAFTVVVYAKHILSFLQFIYHKIMSLNYAYIGFIEEDAFIQIVNLLTHYMFDLGMELHHYIETEIAKLEGWWWDLSKVFANNNPLYKIELLADNILKKSSRLKFALPEVKGRFLYLLSAPELIKEVEQDADIHAVEGIPFLERMLGQAKKQKKHYIAERLHKFELAILAILSLIQSKADYANVMQHMSLNPMEKVAIEGSEQRLYQSLGIYGRSKMRKLKTFKEILDDEAKEVIYPTVPPIKKPVKSNQTIMDLIQQNERS